MNRDQLYAMAVSHKPFKELITERLRNQANPKGFVVSNAAGPKAVLRIYDEIGLFGVTADQVAAALEDITADELEVQINSIGGDAFDGVAIYNALRAHPARVTTRVDSLAASAASVIAQAGDHRVMLTGSQLMIHDAWGLAIGNSNVMRDTADVLDKISDSIASIYEERSGEEGMRDRMVSESWFDPDEAVEAGLADEVVSPSKKTRSQMTEPDKFLDQLTDTVVSFEEAAARTAEVVTQRTEEGKPPLSEEAIALFGRVAAALNGLPAEPEMIPSSRRLPLDLILQEGESQSAQLEVIAHA